MPGRSGELFEVAAGRFRANLCEEGSSCEECLYRSRGSGRYNTGHERCTVSRKTILDGLDPRLRRGQSFPPTAWHTGTEQACSSRSPVRRGCFLGLDTGYATGVIFRGQRIHVSLFYRDHRQCLYPRIQAICGAPSWLGAGHTGWGNRHNVSLFWIEFLLAGTPEAIENLSPREARSHV